METKMEGRWVGFYQYRVIFFFIKIKVAFVANLEDLGEENFQGIIKDNETLGGVKEPANVIGSIFGNLISFVKEYPSHKVYYTGEYDKAKEKFIGTWNIPDNMSGSWEMKKENTTN